MRIGFLFNHDQIHQVAHSLPVALALAESCAGARVFLVATNRRLADEVTRLGGDRLKRSRIVIRYLAMRSPIRRLAAGALASMVPSAKLLVYGDHLDFFRALDMLVVSEKTSLLLKTRYRLHSLKLVHTRHGAGDRAIGFDKASARFDLVLASGRKIRDRLIADAGVAPERVRVVGYPKFDLAPAGTPPFAHDADDDRPIVLYNPHVSPHLSSWFAMGRAILDWFLRHDEYRLIFAPHVMLFERRVALTIDRLRVALPGAIDARVRSASHIHIDLGSPASTDMTHTRAADIYLGDVSSQVYEYIERPRPCIFLDAHATPWRADPNFAHWRFGPVLDRVDDLDKALAHAAADHETRYRAVQHAALAETFDLTSEPSSARAARAIAQAAGLNWPARPPAFPAASAASESARLWRGWVARRDDRRSRHAEPESVESG